MSRVIIWPDIYKEQGHWLPYINLAKTLKDAGYTTVEFMGIPDTQSIVAPGNCRTASLTAGQWCTTSPSDEVLTNRMRGMVG